MKMFVEDPLKCNVQITIIKFIFYISIYYKMNWGDFVNFL